jgi:SLA1 homology domain 1, SHD1
MSRSALTAFCFFSLLVPADGRTWTDHAGTHHIEAEIVSFTDDSVVLRTVDKRELRVKFNALSADDILVLREYVHKHPRPDGPPGPLKIDADKAADAVNGIIKKLNVRLTAAAAEDTEVRQKTAYAKAIKDLDDDVKGKVFSLYFPINNVADDRGHTLTLAKPYGVTGFQNFLSWFVPKLSDSKAAEIDNGDALVLKGRGKLIQYDYGPFRPPPSSGPKSLCVLTICDPVSKQLYGLYLQDNDFKIEHGFKVNMPLHVDQPKLVGGVVQPAMAPPFGQPFSPVFGQPAQPINAPFGAVTGQNAAAPNPTSPLPGQSPNLIQPPLNGQTNQTPAAAPIVQTQPAHVAGNVPSPAEAVSQSPESLEPASTIDVKTSYAKYVHDCLTPDKFDQRVVRREKHFPNWRDSDKNPSVDIGHNYSHYFWTAIQSWPSYRQALWLYHNEDNIKRSFYKKLAEQPATKAELARLSRSRVTVDPNFIDPEFTDDPDLMYRDEFVSAIYNSTEFDYNSDWSTPWTILVIFCICAGLIVVSWSKYEGWI